MLLLPFVAAFFPIVSVAQEASAEREPLYGGKKVSEWAERLQSKESESRIEALQSLGKLGVGPEAIPLLIQALKETEARVRQGAAKALGSFGPEARAAIPALTEALDDAANEVQSEAGEALKMIQTP